MAAPDTDIDHARGVDETVDEKRKRVLVVDDEETLTWSMTKMLTRDRDSYDLAIANLGTDALHVLERDHVDVVVTDIKMPDINGLDLLSMIRDKWPWIKVIIMTAYGSPEVQREASKRGSFQYIEKPFELEDVRTLILKALEEEEQGFVGHVRDLQLVDIIQIGCLGRLTIGISVQSGNRTGNIFIKGGEIVHAESASVVGEEALYLMLGWKAGRFTTEVGAEPAVETIDARWEQLLLEGMRRRDDAALTVEADKTVTTPEPREVADHIEEKAGPEDVVGSIAKRLRHIEGYDGMLCVNWGGEVLRLDGERWLETDPQLMRVVTTGARQLGTILGEDQPRRVTVGQGKRQMLIVPFHDFGMMFNLSRGVTGEEFHSSARSVLEQITATRRI
jgi:CheY-like chemotaxis protein